MMTSLSWHSRSLAEDRLGETGGQPSGALAGVSAGRLVTSGAVAMDWCSQASSCATATSGGMVEEEASGWKSGGHSGKGISRVGLPRPILHREVKLDKLGSPSLLKGTQRGSSEMDQGVAVCEDIELGAQEVVTKRPCGCPFK